MTKDSDRSQRLKELFLKLTPQWEQALRRTVASETIADVYSQSEEQAPVDRIEQLYAEMTVIEIAFCSCPDESDVFGTLSYRAERSFPDISISVQFRSDLSLDETLFN